MDKGLENYNQIKHFAIDKGASLFGVADISDKKEHINIYPEKILDKFDRAISIGLRLSSTVLKTIVDRPNKLYTRHYKIVNMLLDQLAILVGNKIQEEGYNYIPIPASVLLDWTELTAHASHRAIAYYAGLGWRGRSSLIVNPQYGACVRYVSILTDMPLTADAPIEMSCGKCRACIDVCPAGAIHEDGYDLDACHKMLKHFDKTLHTSLICGVCVKACRGREKQ
ncbi:MAG: hypothetical protein K8T10_09900 [Candidatus Eremiobacteraeota bacterium]|nr:hypothetical protein [Candidatus Eremiobacteraeota bacterium]